MSVLFALTTSNAHLVRCELDRLAPTLSPFGDGRENAVGLGTYAQEEPLLERAVGGADLAEVAARLSGSSVLLYRAQELPVGRTLEAAAQPFRWRRWLFAHAGRIPGGTALGARLVSLLPEFLQRQLTGEREGEAAFLIFMKLLRDTGQLELVDAEAATVARVLGQALRVVDGLSAEVHPSARSAMQCVATNGRVLVAARVGVEPLWYSLLEGSDRCARCGLGTTPREPDPRVRQHRLLRTVALVAKPTAPAGWVELPAAHALAVDVRLSVKTFPI